MDKVRSLEEVVDRALCVLAAATRSHPKATKAGVTAWLQENGLYGKLSPKEQAFVDADVPDDKDRVYFSWMNERLHVLCWVLGHEPVLGGLSEPRSGTFNDASFNAEGSPARDLVLGNSVMRPLADIQAAAGLIEGRRQLLSDQAAKNEPLSDVEAGIVQERHAAIQWVLCYEDLDWDEVAADA